MSDERFQQYLFRYFHAGSWWSFTIHATSEEDARERLALLNRAQLDGVVQLTIPAIQGTTWLANLICWWKNKRGAAQGGAE
jgi:hypothetical protein